jgi:hypothetical protein
MRDGSDEIGAADLQTPESGIRAVTRSPPITEAFQHCFGIGPVRHQLLQLRGIRSWQDAVNFPDRIPAGIRAAAVTESQRCLSALERHDIAYFLNHFIVKDKWRVLDHYLEQAAFFDIETTGLEYDAQITVICCWHRGQMHTFVEHENLDDFLDLLDDVTLLVSFNGATFDVPRLLAAFHIPELPCPHLDLRWPCYHRGHRGSLKVISQQQRIQRPPDLHDADGALAIVLWNSWMMSGDAAARNRLVRYCASDVLLLAMVAQKILGIKSIPVANLWAHLPSLAKSHDSPEQPPIEQTAKSVWSPPTSIGSFGAANPSKLRARNRTPKKR